MNPLKRFLFVAIACLSFTFAIGCDPQSETTGGTDGSDTPAAGDGQPGAGNTDTDSGDDTPNTTPDDDEGSVPGGFDAGDSE